MNWTGQHRGTLEET